MPLDPQVWMVPPHLRRFPDQVADVYESEETALVEVYELWTWKWNLVSHSRLGPMPDDNKVAQRLGKEVEDFLRIEEDSRAAIEEAEREHELGLRLKELGEAALRWRQAREMQEGSES